MAHRGDERKAAAKAQPPPRPAGRPDHRIGDAERQQAIDVLRAHTGAGRLTLDEFSELAAAVYAAQTYAELEAVGRSLPPGLLPDPEAPQGAPVGGGPVDANPAAAASATPRGSGRKWFVGVMSGGGARGRWRPAPDVVAFAFWGSVHLDFRYAELDGPVDVEAWAIMGSVAVTVAEGTRVELDGMVLMGGSANATRNIAPDPGAPTIRVHARGLWGGVSVRSRKTRAQREAAAEAAGADPSEIDLRAPGLLELPQRILDDVAAAIPGLLAGPPPVRARRHRHDHRGHGPPGPGPGWGGPGVPAPPDPPWSRRSRDASRTDAAAANGPSGTLTMMVTDIVGSTGLAESLGDRRWITVLRHHNDLVRAEVARHGGTEVKAQGDGFLVVFPSARRAILAAIAVQRAVCASDDAHPDAPLRLRIGLHTGEIVDMDGDVLGQNVVVAVRIADHADPGEIVVSGLTRDLTASGGDIAFDAGAEVELKGLSQPWRVHRVSWSPAPA